jgi:hypothetical protein
MDFVTGYKQGATLQSDVAATNAVNDQKTAEAKLQMQYQPEAYANQEKMTQVKLGEEQQKLAALVKTATVDDKVSEGLKDWYSKNPNATPEQTTKQLVTLYSGAGDAAGLEKAATMQGRLQETSAKANLEAMRAAQFGANQARATAATLTEDQIPGFIEGLKKEGMPKYMTDQLENIQKTNGANFAKIVGGLDGPLAWTEQAVKSQHDLVVAKHNSDLADKYKRDADVKELQTQRLMAGLVGRLALGQQKAETEAEKVANQKQRDLGKQVVGELRVITTENFELDNNRRILDKEITALDLTKPTVPTFWNSDEDKKKLKDWQEKKDSLTKEYNDNVTKRNYNNKRQSSTWSKLPSEEKSIIDPPLTQDFEPRASSTESTSPPKAPTKPSVFVENKVYTDAKGNKAKYVNGAWIPQ